MLALLIAEFPFTVANLALFGIASPNLYRTKLWQEGSNHGWASRPDTILYAAANHQPVHTPLVWSNLYVYPAWISTCEKRGSMERKEHTTQMKNIYTIT